MYFSADRKMFLGLFLFFAVLPPSFAEVFFLSLLRIPIPFSPADTLWSGVMFARDNDTENQPRIATTRADELGEFLFHEGTLLRWGRGLGSVCLLRCGFVRGKSILMEFALFRTLLLTRRILAVGDFDEILLFYLMLNILPSKTSVV